MRQFLCSFLAITHGHEVDAARLSRRDPLSEGGDDLVGSLIAGVHAALGPEGGFLVDWDLFRDVHRAAMGPEAEEGDVRRAQMLLEDHRQRCEEPRGDRPPLRFLVEEAGELLVRLNDPEEAPFPSGNPRVAVAVAQRILGVSFRSASLCIGTCASLRGPQLLACPSLCPWVCGENWGSVSLSGLR